MCENNALNMLALGNLGNQRVPEKGEGEVEKVMDPGCSGCICFKRFWEN